MRLFISAISVIAILLSVLWFYYQPGFEPAITTLMGVVGLLSSIFVGRQEKHPTPPSQNSHSAQRDVRWYQNRRRILWISGAVLVIILGCVVFLYQFRGYAGAMR